MGTRVDISADPADPALAGWFAPVLARGAAWCAPNLETECAFLRVNGWELPLTYNEAEWTNSWICSPYTHYVSYAQEEIRRAVPGFAAAPVQLLLGAIGAWFRAAQCNRVVMINNWLMSTNPWPAWDGEGLGTVLAALRERWPDHALVFRSLNERESGPLLSCLRQAGARLIPSRQVWWYDPNSVLVRRSRDLRKDLNLLRRGDLEVVRHEGLDENDFSRLTDLYDQLYLGKYSRHNPQYRCEWLRYLWRGNHLRFTALRQPGGAWVGVEACGEIHGTMVSPVVGYDLTEAPKLGLYRRLAAIPVEAARSRGLPLNLSAGVGRFKALRGGEPVMEYLAVWDRHLPAHRRLPWDFVEAVSRGLLAPAVRHWRL